jgi:hypothetical protein
MRTLFQFIIENNIGDIASVLGLFLAIIGFGITIFTVRKAKFAVLEVRNDIIKIDTISILSEARATMEEIERLHREKAWRILPDRYTVLKKSLISVQGANPDLSKEHKESLNRAVGQFTIIKNKIENILSTHADSPDASKLNKIVTKQIDNLTQVLEEIKNTVGR